MEGFTELKKEAVIIHQALIHRISWAVFECQSSLCFQTRWRRRSQKRNFTSGFIVRSMASLQKVLKLCLNSSPLGVRVRALRTVWLWSGNLFNFLFCVCDETRCLKDEGHLVSLWKPGERNSEFKETVPDRIPFRFKHFKILCLPVF